MEMLGPRMGPSSKQEGPVLTEMKYKNLPKQEPIDKRQSFSKVLESRKAPQELRPVDDRRTEKQEVRTNLGREKTEAKVRKTSDRESAMLNFMDSMESEFGITPVRMLEALAVLDTEDLTRPPEETASSVIANLELAAEEEPQAMDMYLAFVQQWQGLRKDEGGVDPKLAVGAAALANAGMVQAGLDVKTGGPQVANAALDRRMVLNQSLDKMNDQFFMKGIAATPVVDGARDPQQTADVLGKLAEESQLQGFKAVPRENFFASELAPPQTVGELAGPEAHDMIADSSAVDLQIPADLEGGGKTADLEALMRKMNAEPVVLKAEPGMVSMKSAEPKILDISALQIPGFGGAAVTSGESSMGGEMEGGDSDGAQSEAHDPRATDFAQMMRAEPGAKAASVEGNAGAVSAFAMTESEAKENLEALKDQTQLMVTKGGGEARIKLNQEGLGEVTLKVLVHEGKVNIEMKTDNAETKKLLESSIADLKTSLSAQKLSVDNVKVDVGTSDQQSAQQRAMDFQQDMGRQQARQMMNQFREESAARRDPFFEMSGIKAYGRKRAELDPIGPASNIAPRAVIGRGDRMNLVA